jgi:hypothetical protein
LKKLPRSVPNTAAVMSSAGVPSQGGSPTVQRYHLMLDFAFPWNASLSVWPSRAW